MLILSNRLQTVMFDPLSYIHPQRFALPDALNSAKQHAIVNRMLLDHYQLSSCIPSVAPGGLDDLLLNNWIRLPQSAYLLACQRFRIALSRGAKLLSLPGWARSFAMLPLSQSGYDAIPADGLSATALLAYGFADLLSHCQGSALALRQRIPLLFPPRAETVVFPAPIATAERNDILLILALQHVKKFPGSTPLPGA